MKRILFIAALILITVSGFSYATTYNGADPADLDSTTPTEGATVPSEINDSIREIKAVYLNQMAVNSGGATTLGSTNSVYLCTSAGTITLPAVATVSSASIRKDIWVLNESTGTCTVDGSGSETIDGALTASLTKQYQPLHLIANTSGWYSTNAAYIANSPVTGAGYKYLLINASGVLPDNIADGAGSTLDADTLDSYNTALGNTTATTTRIIPAINSTGLDPTFIDYSTASLGSIFPSFRATSTAQTISSTAATKIHFNTEQWDTNNNYDSSTNYRFTPTVAGKYFINAKVRLTSADTDIFNIYIFKNGAEYKRNTNDSGNGQVSLEISDIVDMNGSSDYIEIYVQSNADTSYSVDTYNNFTAAREM